MDIAIRQHSPASYWRDKADRAQFFKHIDESHNACTLGTFAVPSPARRAPHHLPSLAHRRIADKPLGVTRGSPQPPNAAQTFCVLPRGGLGGGAGVAALKPHRSDTVLCPAYRRGASRTPRTCPAAPRASVTPATPLMASPARTARSPAWCSRRRRS